jgi:TolB-like protein
MTIGRRALALACISAILLLASAVSAQEAAPQSAAEAKKIVAVARFEDRDGAVRDAAIVVTLDTMLWSTLAGRTQSGFDLVRLEPPSPAGCGLRCALEAARTAEATYLVRGEAQRVDDELLATVEIVSVQTGAVMQSHRSELVLDEASLVGTATDAIRSAADQLFKEKPVRPEEPYLAKKPIIAVARLNDAVPRLQDQDLFLALDDALYSAIAGQRQTRFRINRLEPTEDACPLTCALERAKASGAMYVLWSAIEREGDRVRIVASLAATENGWSLKNSRSFWFAEIRQLRNGVDRVAAEIMGALFGSSVRPNRQWSQPAGRSDIAETVAEYREQALESPAYAEARSARNAGVTLFILGVLLDAVGGGLIGAGQPADNTGLVATGYVLGGVGVLMFVSGLAIWVSNHVRMNKIERGIPLGRQLRLDGLAPIVASRDLGAPGLSARFSF